MPLLYAHRGAAVELPENTIPSFDLALSLGADVIETDAHLTSDGHIVLSHDEAGLRMAGRPQAIANTPLSEVQSWDAGARFVSRAGESFAGRGYRMPTLEEVLRQFPKTAFNVDAKSHHPQMAARIVDLVHRLGAEDRVLLASFRGATLRAVRRLGYRGKTGLAQSEVLRLIALPRAVLQRVRLRGAAAQIPHRIYGIDLGTRAIVDKCHSLGLAVHYWTINDTRLAERLVALGADAIMTDDPRAIAPVVKRA